MHMDKQTVKQNGTSRNNNNNFVLVPLSRGFNEKSHVPDRSLIGRESKSETECRQLLLLLLIGCQENWRQDLVRATPYECQVLDTENCSCV